MKRWWHYPALVLAAAVPFRGFNWAGRLAERWAEER